MFASVLVATLGSLAGLARLASAPPDRREQQPHSLVTDMFVATLELELLLGDVHSLKEKRSIVRPLVAELRRRFEVSAVEADAVDLHRRAVVGVGAIGADGGHCSDVLDACEQFMAGRPEVELLSARRRLFSTDD